MRHFARGSVALTQPLRLRSTRQHVGHIQSTNIGPRLVGTRQASRANNVHGRRDAVELGLSPLAPRLLQTRRTGARDRRHHGFTEQYNLFSTHLVATRVAFRANRLRSQIDLLFQLAHPNCACCFCSRESFWTNASETEGVIYARHGDADFIDSESPYSNRLAGD